MIHFKRVIVTMVLVCMFGVYAQDAAGDYQLNGTNVRYTSLYRGTEPGLVMINDTYGMGITFPALTFNTGDAMNQFVNGPYPRNVLAAIGVNLNVSLYDDGSGYIYEGSTYPTAITVDCAKLFISALMPIEDRSFWIDCVILGFGSVFIFQISVEKPSDKPASASNFFAPSGS